MIRGDEFYTRFVGWMKVILPLVALGLLSTLFLLSKTVDTTGDLPFAEVDLEQRAQDQGATNPSFAGVAPDGEQMNFRASTVRPDPKRPDYVLAETVTANLILNGGGVINITGDRGEANQDLMVARLAGNVRIVTSTGYDLRTEQLNGAFETLTVLAPGQVTGNGPPGDLEAGRMQLTSNEETGSIHLVFTDGVKLIYKVQGNEE